MANGGSLALSATTSGTGVDSLAYKVVDSNRAIVGYGTANSTSEITVDASGLAGGDYTVYVWAQNSEDINSHEGSTPTYFTMSVEAAPTLTGYTLTPDTTTPAAGTSMNVSLAPLPAGADPGLVDWQVSGITDLLTGIYGGRLFISPLEGGHTLTVTATNASDPSITGSVTLNVVKNPGYPYEEPINGPVEVTKGEDGVWTFDGPYDRLMAVYLDGLNFTTDNLTPTDADLLWYSYTGAAGDVAESSIIVTLYADFLKTLSKGEHTVTVAWLNENEQPTYGQMVFNLLDPVPAPGDSNTPVLWFSLLGLSALALCSALFIRYKKRKQAEK